MILPGTAGVSPEEAFFSRGGRIVLAGRPAMGLRAGHAPSRQTEGRTAGSPVTGASWSGIAPDQSLGGLAGDSGRQSRARAFGQGGIGFREEGEASSGWFA